MKTLPFLAFLFALALPALPLAAAQVTAQLDPDRIDAGEAAQLTVTIDGSFSGDPALPSVPGLQFTPMGQSSNFQFVNGAISRSTTFTYQVTADRAGTYAIPPVAVGALRSNPVTLAIGGGGNGGGPAPAPAPGGNAPSAPASAPGGTDDVAAPSGGEAAFLRLVLPKKEFYVGETVPAQIRAYFRAGVQASLDNGPTLANDSFTLNPVTIKPERTDEMLGGQAYAVLSWPSALTAVKAGPATLDLAMPVTLIVPQRSHRPRGGMFDDPFFDQAFGAMVQKQATLHNDSQPVQVLPLPAENRPADFSGAVGDFSVGAEVTPRDAAEGDPLTVKLTVDGKGNFDRVAPPLLTGAAGWKSYPPSSHFTPRDAMGTEGAKTFEQAAIPARPGAQEVPALSFSYFDPEARRYLTKTTPPLPVTIAAAPPSATVAKAPAPAAPAPAPAPPADLVANHIAEGHPAATLVPLWLRPGYYAALAAPLLALGAGLATLRWRRRRADDVARLRREARDRAIRVSLETLDRAAAAGDAALFFQAARAALQQALGAAWQLPPETITLSEVEARAAASEGIRAIFQRADAVAYSGGGAAGDDFNAWKQVVRDELQRTASA